MYSASKFEPTKDQSYLVTTIGTEGLIVVTGYVTPKLGLMLKAGGVYQNLLYYIKVWEELSNLKLVLAYYMHLLSILHSLLIMLMYLETILKKIYGTVLQNPKNTMFLRWIMRSLDCDLYYFNSKVKKNR